jgi:probable F420-dependent oxidoreductase
VHIDVGALSEATPTGIEEAAVSAERDGYDGLGAAEIRHDVFTGLALAARVTRAIALQSAIAVAFARNPMSLAYAANDIQLISAGRFRLGVGSQVRPHIERRFAMPWSNPASRMEDYLAAVRAIWTSWASGDRLAYTGSFYQHTLMTEFFNPGPNPFGNPPILLAAVGQKMTEVAGRAADGMLVHPLTTEQYLRTTTLPTLREARGGSLAGFDLCLPALVAVGADESSRAVAAHGVRRQIAFYASTPAYRAVLDLHGWGELADRLNAMSRRNEWDEMGRAIPDEVLDAFAVVGTPEHVAADLLRRFGNVLTRVSLYTPYQADPAAVRSVVGALREARS